MTGNIRYEYKNTWSFSIYSGGRMGHKLLLLSALILTVNSAGFAKSKKSDLPKDVSFIDNHPYKKGQLLVRWKKNVTIQSINLTHQSLKAKIVQKFDRPSGLELVQIPEEIALKNAIQAYQKNPKVAYVEPNYYVHTQVTPSDSKWAEQWALNNTGQTAGTPDADVNAPEMWELSTGSPDVVLGIIDTGVFYSHPDLAANIWVNPGEIADNGIDDDSNGYVDDIHGINARNKKGDPKDDNGHGSHVAGIMGAVGNNSEGISGINQKIAIIGCKFLDASGGGSISDAIICMDYFLQLKTRASQPVNLVATNNSWAGGGYSQAMMDAVKAHKDAGILFMAAASNEANNNDEVETYPANYPSSNIISVAASNHKDALSDFSNYGKYSVHVSAPGEDILSTVINGNYESYSGTSMATPHVTGMAGLIKSYYPELDWKAIKNLIIAGGQPIAAGKDKTISARRLRGAGPDGTGSLTCKDQTVNARLSPKSSTMTIVAGKTIDFAVMNINCANPNGSAPVISDVAGFSLNDDGLGIDNAAQDGIYSAQWTPAAGGHYNFDLGEGGLVQVNVYNPASWQTYTTTTPEYGYRTITGTKLSLGDDSVTTVASPFPIRFAGDEGGFATINVGSNGILSFTDSRVSGYQNQTLPIASNQSIIAPYWDDLDPSRTGGVYYEVVGEAPNRELVIEWRGVAHFESRETLTFEVVFFENSSNVLFNYADVNLKNPSYENGASATIGIQIGTNAATQYGFNKAVLTDNSSILLVNQ